MLTYDAEAIVGRLRSIHHTQGLSVAAACADKLLRSFGAEVPPAAIDRGLLQEIVDKLWNSAATDDGYPGDAVADLQSLSDVISGDYGEDLGVSEHVILGLYYSVEAVHDGDSAKAELVAKNLYEAADYLVVANADFDISDPGARERVLASAPVQDALSFIDRVLVLSSDILDNSQRIMEVRRVVTGSSE